MTITIVQSTNKYCYGHVTYKKKKYKLYFGHPNQMLRDENISWESKGYLSSAVMLPDPINAPLRIIREWIKFGYLVEVENV